MLTTGKPSRNCEDNTCWQPATLLGKKLSISLICVKKTNRKHTEMYSWKSTRNQFISNETVRVIGSLSSESKPWKCPLQFAHLIFDNIPEIGATYPGCRISQVSCSHIRVDRQRGHLASRCLDLQTTHALVTHANFYTPKRDLCKNVLVGRGGCYSWWCTPLTPGRQRQAGRSEFKARLLYTASSSPTRTMQWVLSLGKKKFC